MKYLPNTDARPPGLIRKGVAAVVGIAVLGLGLMFSMVLMVLMLFAAMLAFGYFRWKMRGLKKQLLFHQFRGMAMQQQRDEGEPAKGEVIEGEAVRVDKDEK